MTWSATTVQTQIRTLYPKCKCFSCCSSGMGTGSLLPEDWKLPQHCSALLLRAVPRALPGQPHTATMAQLSCHLQVHPACKRKAACATSRGCKCGGHAIHSVWFTEQVVFTSVHKVKPPALIIQKNQTMGQVHDSEGLVQIFAK